VDVVTASGQLIAAPLHCVLRGESWRYHGRLMLSTPRASAFPDFTDDLDAVLRAGRAEGVRGVVTIGTDRESNVPSWSGGEAPEVWATAGIHPHDAAEATEATSRRWRGSRLREPRSSGWARWGSTSSASLAEERQESVFRRQLALARAVAKPVVIHCRRAQRGDPRHSRDEKAGGDGGVMHLLLGRRRDRPALSRPGAPDLAGRVPSPKERARAVPTCTVRARDHLVSNRLSLPAAHAPPRQAQRAGYVALTAARIAELREWTRGSSETSPRGMRAALLASARLAYGSEEFSRPSRAECTASSAGFAGAICSGGGFGRGGGAPLRGYFLERWRGRPRPRRGHEITISPCGAHLRGGRTGETTAAGTTWMLSLSRSCARPSPRAGWRSGTPREAGLRSGARRAPGTE